MSLVTVSSFGYDIFPEMQKWVGLAYKEIPPQYTQFFTVLKSDRAEEIFAKASGLGLPIEISEGESVSYDSMRQFWRKAITHRTFALGTMITRKALNDCKSDLPIRIKGKELGRNMMLMREHLAANYIDNGFTTANGGDGVALLSASHPRIDGGTYSNILAAAADLSEAAIEQAIIEMQGIVNERGLRVLNVAPRKLIVSRWDAMNASRILNTTGQVYTPDNTINVIKNDGLIPEGYAVNRYLQDQDAWFLTTDAVQAEQGLVMYDRMPLEFSSDNVFDNMNAKFKAVMELSVCHQDPLCIFGSAGV